MLPKLYGGGAVDPKEKDGAAVGAAGAVVVVGSPKEKAPVAGAAEELAVEAGAFGGAPNEKIEPAPEAVVALEVVDAAVDGTPKVFGADELAGAEVVAPNKLGAVPPKLNEGALVPGLNSDAEGVEVAAPKLNDDEVALDWKGAILVARSSSDGWEGAVPPKEKVGAAVEVATLGFVKENVGLLWSRVPKEVDEGGLVVEIPDDTVGAAGADSVFFPRISITLPVASVVLGLMPLSIFPSCGGPEAAPKLKIGVGFEDVVVVAAVVVGPAPKPDDAGAANIEDPKVAEESVFLVKSKDGFSA